MLILSGAFEGNEGIYLGEYRNRDGVNLAARLETLTKTPEYDTRIIISSATMALTRASAAAQAAGAKYHQAQLDAAELNLRRQRQLLKLGSAHKSDVARAEEKLAQLQQGDEAPH